MPADDADGALERLAADPQLAVERDRRQAVEEPVGGEVDVALARDELLAVPVGPHAVELLAHPPADEVGLVVPRLGEQHRRAFLRLALGLARRRERADGAEPGLLRLVAAQPAEVLAGAALDRQRLVAPRRAGAGVDPADVLEHVGLGAGAFHLDRFTVGQVWHGRLLKNALECGDSSPLFLSFSLSLFLSP